MWKTYHLCVAQTSTTTQPLVPYKFAVAQATLDRDDAVQGDKDSQDERKRHDYYMLKALRYVEISSGRYKVERPATSWVVVSCRHESFEI
jgi:hypothetical protein